MTEPTPFTPPADSAINVRDLPPSTRPGQQKPTFGYVTADLTYVFLIPPGPDGGPWDARWVPRFGIGGQARGRLARIALNKALANFPDYVLAAQIKAALLMRKTEYTWRGPITPERVAAAWDEALVENVERCKTCGGYGVITCPDCNHDVCFECQDTTEVHCFDCGGYDTPLTAADVAAVRRVHDREAAFAAAPAAITNPTT